MALTMYPNIEAERARQGLTLDSFCSKISCTRQTYWNWQKKVTQIPADKLVAMADLFGVSTDYILGRST